MYDEMTVLDLIATAFEKVNAGDEHGPLITELASRLSRAQAYRENLSQTTDFLASDGTSCSAGPLTAEMIREMLGHVPYDVGDMPDRWQWMANYLNETMRDPGVICPCCNITRSGEMMDHLPPPPRPSLPNNQLTDA